MNKTEVISQVAEMTGIDPIDCTKVLDAFEEVLGQELASKGWKNGIFETVFKLMSNVKNKKDAQEK